MPLHRFRRIWTISNSTRAYTTLKFTAEQQQNIFRYTSGRWLFNEDMQNALRYVPFDIEAMQNVACKAVGAQRCLKFEKLQEGSYNKIFSLAFDNGSEAIVRIPFPFAGPPFLTTASEVATLEFAREVLDIPAPRVLAYEASAKNPVGTEYIILEKAEGVDLATRWADISGAAIAMPFFVDFCTMESKFERAAFSQIGSLYFTKDVSPELQTRSLFDTTYQFPKSLKATELLPFSEKYRIGPITDRQWWRQERLGMNMDRGPWPDVKSYLEAVVNNERAWILQFASSDSRIPLRVRPTSRSSIDEHLMLLDTITNALSNGLLPKPSYLMIPILWHPDFSVTNIRIAPDGPAQIRSIIDWQHAVVAPYFVQARPSKFLEFNYESTPVIPPPPNGLPSLPENMRELSEEEQETCRLLLKLANRDRVYRQMFERNTNRALISTIPTLNELATLPFLISRSWTDGLAPIYLSLIHMSSVWMKKLPDFTCPIQFTEEEISKFKDQLATYIQYDKACDQLTLKLGISGDGWVAHEAFEATKILRDQAGVEWSEKLPFPFKDGQFSFFLS